MRPSSLARRLAWLFAWLQVVQGCDGDAVRDEEAFQIEEASVASVHAAYRRGTLSAEQLTRAYLARIARYDAGDTGLHALISVQPEAVAEAARLDERYARTGQFVGPLHGIPIVIEDTLDTFDLPTSAGLSALASSVPPDDAFVVQRLRAAGAIILGKTNMMELALAGHESRSSVAGATCNAYDRARPSLGASGGAAVAVSANFAVAALGTDNSASLVRPAAANGVVALRPSFGRVSRDGVVTGLDDVTVPGPVARTVADAALLLSVIAGADPADPATRAAPASDGVAQGRLLDMDALREARVALVRELADSARFAGQEAKVDAGARKLLIGALGALREQGVRVSGVSIAAIDAELTPLLARAQEEPPLRFYLDAYLATRGDAAPVRSFDELVASGSLLPELHDLSSSASAVRVPPDMSDAQAEAALGRALLRERLLALMNSQKLDVLVYLTLAAPPQLAGGQGDPYGPAGQLSALSGFPSLTVPIGLLEGLPLGLTMLSRPFQEHALLSHAAAFEAATHARVPPVLD